MAVTSTAMTFHKSQTLLFVMTGLADDKRGRDVEQRRSISFVMTGLVPVIHASTNLYVVALARRARCSSE